MLGSTFISENDLEKLRSLKEDLDALDDLAHVSLDFLSTLDFETLAANSGVRWMTAEPLVYDEEDGIVVVKVSPEGLERVLTERNEFDEDQVIDLDSLRAFVRAHGTENIYELATF